MTEKSDSGARHKTLVFKSGSKWTGRRTWICSLEGTLDIPGAPPVDFGGEPDRWTPEDFMVASIDSCTVATFISQCLRHKLEFISLESSTEGFLEHTGKGYVFTRMVVRPKVVVKSEEDVEIAIDLLHKAHSGCFMANSVTAEITIEPDVTVAEV